MTLIELSIEYRSHAQCLQERIKELKACFPDVEQEQRSQMEERIRLLSAMWREARDLALVMERYYDRGYRKNVRYTI